MAAAGEHIPAMGLTFALLGASVTGGGMSAKSFLSSLMAVSTLALSTFVSVTYRLLPMRAAGLATAAALGNLREFKGDATERQPRRLVERSVVDAKRCMIMCRLSEVRCCQPLPYPLVRLMAGRGLARRWRQTQSFGHLRCRRGRDGEICHAFFFGGSPPLLSARSFGDEGGGGAIFLLAVFSHSKCPQNPHGFSW